MAVVMEMRWSGVTREQYDEAARRVDWEGDVPTGAIFHMIGWDGEDIRVTDLWETAADFNTFLVTRLLPAIGDLSFAGEPTISIYPAYKVLAPGYAEERLRSVA